MHRKDELPIVRISNDIKEFKKALSGQLSALKINEKTHPILKLKKVLHRISDDLIKQIPSLPPFTVEATFDEEGLDNQAVQVDGKLSAALTERERTMAALRDAISEVDQMREEKKDARLLMEVKTQGKLAELRVEQEVDEEVGCCRRNFCCFFPQAQQKLENLTSEKIQKQAEIESELKRLDEEKERLRKAAEQQSAVQHDALDKVIEEEIDLVKAKAAAKAKENLVYEAYKHTVTQEIMLLLIRANSCVRRIAVQVGKLIEKPKSSTEKSPLIDREGVEAVVAFVNDFDRKLEKLCSPLFCVDPDDDGHKICFFDRGKECFYLRYHGLDASEKENIVERGVISEAAANIIFSWEMPIPAPSPIVAAFASPGLATRRDSKRF